MPDAGAFWRVCAEHKVNVLFAAPTFRAIKKDFDGVHIGKYDLSNLHTIFMAGERLDPPTLAWAQEKTGKPIIDNWWQTETGWPMVANPIGLEPMPVKAGSSTKPVPGYKIEILNEQGEVLGPNQQGFIAIKRPLPPCCLPTIWRNHERFESSYLNVFRLLYLVAMVATSIMTDICTLWAGLMTLLMSQDIGYQLERWRKWWLDIQLLQNVP